MEKGVKGCAARAAHSAQPDYDERRTPETKGPRHQGTTVRNQALGELWRMIDRGCQTGRPARVSTRKKTVGLNVEPERDREIGRDDGADVTRANTLARSFVMVRGGLRRFRRATQLAHFLYRIGKKIADKK